MKVINKIEEFTEQNKFVVVALGNFDGVHLGHKALLKTMTGLAKENQGVSIVFTFDPHPVKVLTGKSPKMLNTKAEKEAFIARQRADYLLNFPFNIGASKQSPEDFVKDYLLDGLGANHVVVGFNYFFGKGGKGDVALLKTICAKYGCGVTVLEPVQADLATVSSTVIRKLISEGKINGANSLLGYKYVLSGKVVKGLQLGRTIGFPTANVDFNKDMQLPAFGVYAAYAECDGKILKAVVNVGLRPTVKNNIMPTVEANCLDFSGDLYDKIMSVHFVSEIRPEQKFASLDDLKVQIAKDAAKARQILYSV